MSAPESDSSRDVRDSDGQAFTGRFDAATERILPSSRVTRLHLVRHGAVQGLTQRIVRGQLDEPLSTEGCAESTALARWFAAHVPRADLIVSSDLVRCRALAESIASAQSSPDALPVVLDARLREQSMGRWEGRSWAEISALEPAAVSAYWDDYFETRPTGGESLAEVDARAGAWLDEMLAQHAGERMIVVTHIGVIRVLLCRLLGVRGDEALRFAPATASHTALQIGDAGAVLNVLGERAWQADVVDASAREVPASSSIFELDGGPPASIATRPPARRIAVSGSAGTGKTTLGRRLAEERGLPFLEERMRRRLESGFDVRGLSTTDWMTLIEADWKEQRATEEACIEGFVADRSSLDYAAFWLHYGLHEDRDATERWMARFFAEARRYERILLFPWGTLPLVDDGVRSTNRWTQLRFQVLLEGLIERYVEPERVVRVPASLDFEQRLAFVLEHV